VNFQMYNQQHAWVSLSGRVDCAILFFFIFSNSHFTVIDF